MENFGYASRKLKPAERNYSPTEGECLAVVWSLQKWKPYVLDQLCQVYTDHEAIYWLWYKAELSGRLFPWIRRMQEFNLQIFHKPSKEMIVTFQMLYQECLGVLRLNRRAKTVQKSIIPKMRRKNHQKSFR